MDLLKEVGGLIFIDTEPNEKQKELVKRVVDISRKRLLAYLPKKVTDVPAELEFIVIEVAIRRFNRIGSEGMSQEAVDGRSQVFSANDFEDFMGVIDAWVDSYMEDKGSKKKLRFL